MEINPFFSIILPVYNSGKFLDDAVKSILHQDFKDFELFLMDDGSTDGSSEKCDSYAALDPRIIVVHQKNAGMGAARNKAISMANGKYIGFCDHDDWFEPECLRKCYAYLQASPVDVIKFGCKEIYIENNKIKKTRVLHPRSNVTFFKENMDKAFLFKYDDDYMAYIWDGFYKAEIFNDETLFNTEMRAGYEDEEIQMKMFLNIQSITFIQDVFYIHNIRSDFSNSKKHNDNQQNAMLIAAKAANKAISELKVKLLCPEIGAVLTGRHLITALRCTVYAASDCDIKKRLIAIRENDTISQNLRSKYVLLVMKRKWLWGCIYALFTYRSYAILKILVLGIRRIKVRK